MFKSLEEYLPPDRMIPLGFQVRSASLVVQGSISAYTLRALRRRRMRWLVWLPKSNTRMVCIARCQLKDLSD